MERTVYLSEDAARVLLAIVERAVVGDGQGRKLLTEAAKELREQGVQPHAGDEIIAGRVWVGDAEGFAQAARGFIDADLMDVMHARHPELACEYYRGPGDHKSRDAFAELAVDHESDTDDDADRWLDMNRRAVANHAAALRHPELKVKWFASDSPLTWLETAATED